MAEEERLEVGEAPSLQPTNSSGIAQRRTPYVKPMLTIEKTGSSVSLSLGNFKTQYPLVLPLVVCLAYFIWMVYNGAHPLFNASDTCLYLGGGEADSIFRKHEWWRLVTSIFAHADVFHLLGNMAAYIFGVFFLREVLSPWKVVAVFFACGLAGSLFCSVTAAYVFVGASGGILGLYGAFIGYGILDADLFKRHQNALLVAFVVVLISIAGSFRVGVSLAIHAAGLLTGFFIGCGVPLWKQRNAD